MSLSPGQTLSHYELLAPLGAGAMGEVWRASDTRLGREVAIKVLPAHLADDEERLRRFEREARSVASLNHPRVAQIHGVDQVGAVCFLVLELVPGASLAARLAKGALPLDEAVAVGAQIADGLEAAHEAGLIHRDLKPANVQLMPDGQIKVLDFGLAKSSRSDDGGDTTSDDSVLSTEAGRLLGTPTYMAPEQARGRPIDRRVDVWAFGCVVFECLTGQRAYGGESLSDVLAAVLEREPDWSALPPLPSRLDELLRRCLEKDPRRRLRDIGEARVLLEGLAEQGPAALAESAASDAGPATARSGGAGPWRAVALAALVVLAGALALWFGNQGEDTPTRPLYANLSTPHGATVLFSGDLAGPPVVSPDGTTLAYVARREGETQRLWIHRLDEPEPLELPSTEGARFPFWSPDGSEVAYFTNTRLRRCDLASGTVRDVVEVGAARGGAWTGDGRIVYTPTFRESLWIVDVEGGEPRQLTTVDQDLHTSHRWPTVIPGSDHFLFVAVTAQVGQSDKNGIYLARLDGDAAPRRVLTCDYSPGWADGHLLHVRDDALLATRLDLDSGELGERSTLVANRVAPDLSIWHAQFSVSPGGVIAYHRMPDDWSEDETLGYSWSAAGDRISSLDRDGRTATTYAEGVLMYSFALSPDGRNMAMDVLAPDGFTDIWIHPTAWVPDPRNDDVEGAMEESVVTPAARHLTFLPGPELRPVWSPGSDEVAFRWDGDEDHPRGIYRKAIDGGTEILVRDNNNRDDYPTDWTPDGRWLVITTDTMLPSPKNDILAVPLDGGEEVTLASGPGAQYRGKVSPDGRWLAYTDSAGTGRTDVRVVPFAPAWPADQRDRTWLVSDSGGYGPRWSPEGDELFYVTETGLLLSVAVDLGGDSFDYAAPRPLFQSPWQLDSSYDPTPDNSRGPNGFFFLDREPATEVPISLVLGWKALLSGDG